MKRVLVDMSCTILHHGHIRLLRRAKEHGYVIVALTTDEEILRHKGYTPELSYEHRREILESIVYVNDVIPSPWLIDDEYIREHNIDILVHGDDNSNVVRIAKVITYPRTESVSSSDLRRKASYNSSS